MVCSTNEQAIFGTYVSDDANLVSAFSNDSSVANNFLDTCNNKQISVICTYRIFLCNNFIDLHVCH